MQAFENMISGLITQKAYQAKCERCDAYIRTTEAKISALEEQRKKEEIIRSPSADAFQPYTNLRHTHTGDCRRADRQNPCFQRSGD